MYCRGNPIKYSDPSGYDIYPPGWDITGNTFKQPYTKADTRAAIKQVKNVLKYVPEAMIIRFIWKSFQDEKPKNLDDIFRDPNSLERHHMAPDEVKKMAEDEGLKVTKLKQGGHEGEGMRIEDEAKDRTIYWHPGKGHHGPEPYWKLTKGGNEGGTIRIGPQFPKYPGGPML